LAWDMQCLLLSLEFSNSQEESQAVRALPAIPNRTKEKIG